MLVDVCITGGHFGRAPPGGRLPMLADAVMDADCDDEQVIGHCRSEGIHVRGCWVVDRVLGLE